MQKNTWLVRITAYVVFLSFLSVATPSAFADFKDFCRPEAIERSEHPYAIIFPDKTHVDTGLTYVLCVYADGVRDEYFIADKDNFVTRGEDGGELTDIGFSKNGNIRVFAVGFLGDLSLRAGPLFLSHDSHSGNVGGIRFAVFDKKRNKVLAVRDFFCNPAPCKKIEEGHHH